MYAVVDIKGFQYRLEKGDTLRVPKIELEVGKKIKLSDVLLVADDETYSIGQPYVEGVVVEATVTGQKKRRKDYSVKRGHRQDYTEISIDHIKISRKKSKKPDEETPEAAEPAAMKPEAEESVTETAEAAEKHAKKAKPVRQKNGTAKSSTRKLEKPEAEKS